jgi:hypothetical protein
MFVNWYLTIVLWLSIVYEVYRIERRLVRGTKTDEEEKNEEKERNERKLPLWPLIISTVSFFFIGLWLGVYDLATPIHAYLLGSITLRIAIYWVVGIFTAEKPFSRSRKFFMVKKSERSWGAQYDPRWKRVIFAIIMISALLAVAIIFIPRSIGYWQATSFKGDFNSFKTGSIEIFPEIDPSNLRVITSEIARSIAELKRTSAESFVTSINLGKYEGELCFIATISEKPWLGMLVGDSNRIREAVIIPLNDATGEKAKVVPFAALFAEGLWLGNDIFIHGSDAFPLRKFTRGYLTAMDNKLVIVTTSYIEVPFGPYIDPRVHVWDPVFGNLIAEYTPENAPEWVIQRWDESYLETMGNAFGDYRWTAENDLNYWTGLPTYSDRGADPSEPEGLRYQTWGDELTAVYLFDNKRNEQRLEMMIVATNENLTLYSVEHLGLLSPDDAKDLAVAGLPVLPEKKQYFTPLALVYRIGASVFYHIPIYTTSENRYYPAYFALVDCQSRSLLREETGKYGGMIPTAKALYERVTSGKTENIIEGVLIDKDTWVEAGNTRIWLTINTNGTNYDVLVKAESEWMTPEAIGKILDKEIGQPIVVKVDENYIVIEIID